MKYQEADKVRDKQQIRSRLALRERLQCKDFEWYLNNVWPNHFFPTDDRFFGQIIKSSSKQCLTRPISKGVYSQPSGFVIFEDCMSPPNLNQMFVMLKNGLIMADESVCLDAPENYTRNKKPKVKLMACSGFAGQIWKYNEREKSIQHVSSDMCLESLKDDYNPVISSCTGYNEQNWELKSIPWK